MHQIIFSYFIFQLANDLEQINTLDKVFLHDDESDFLIIPSTRARRHGVISIERHRRRAKHCHDNHTTRHTSRGKHSHCDHISTVKDAFGHYIYRKHYVIDDNLSPNSDAYIPYYSMHIPSFPFEGKKKVKKPDVEAKEKFNFLEMGLFH